jgi:D-glycero-beta-D-manno-heptose-7-phosphate kinase
MDQSSKDKLLARIYAQKIFIVGDFIVDEYVYGKTSRLSREAPVPILVQQEVKRDLGGAANAVRNVAAWGGTIFPFGYLGEDENGKWLRDQLHRMAINTGGLFDSARPTSVKTRYITSINESPSQQVLRVDRICSDHYPYLQQAALAEDLYNTFMRVKPDLIIVSDYGLGALKGSVSFKVLFELSREDAKIQIPIFVDSRYDLNMYPNVTAVTPNTEEALAYTKITPVTPWDIREVGEKILRELDCQHVLLTRGKDGMALFSRKGNTYISSHFIPADSRFSPVDITGAGDTSIVSFARALVAGASPEDAMKIANIAAGISVSQQGAAVADLEKTLSYLE